MEFIWKRDRCGWLSTPVAVKNSEDLALLFCIAVYVFAAALGGIVVNGVIAGEIVTISGKYGLTVPMNYIKMPMMSPLIMVQNV